MARPRLRPDVGERDFTATIKDVKTPLTQGEINIIERCTAFGFTQAGIAQVLNIKEEYLILYKHKYPEVERAMNAGKEKVQSLLIKMMMDFVCNPNIPYEAKRKDIHFILQRKFGWGTQITVNETTNALPGVPTFQQVTTIDMEQE